MGEVLRADWFDLEDEGRNTHWAWLHNEFLPALKATQSVGGRYSKSISCL